MTNYYLKGYTLLAWIKNGQDVKREQLRLSVKTDGIWGEKTQSAWDAMRNSGKSVYTAPEGINTV